MDRREEMEDVYTEERFFQEGPCEWDEMRWLEEMGLYPIPLNRLIDLAEREFFSPEREDDFLPF